MSHKLFTALLISVLSIAYQPISPQNTKEKKYLPKALKKVKFGTPLAEFRKGREMTPSDTEGYEFRKVFIETVNKDGLVEIVYYFDSDGDQPLYEMILTYSSEVARDQVATKRLGKANYKDKEWKLDIGGTYPLHAWTHKTKLVYAVPLLGTEWNEKGTIELQ